jgi:hypothetical protein
LEKRANGVVQNRLRDYRVMKLGIKPFYGLLARDKNIAGIGSDWILTCGDGLTPA